MSDSIPPVPPASQADATPIRPYLTAMDVAELLRVQAATVNAWARSGQFPGAFCLGRSGWRIPAGALDDFRQRRVAGPTRTADILPTYDTSKFGAWRRKGA